MCYNSVLDWGTVRSCPSIMVARQAVPLTPSESLGLAKLLSYQHSSCLTPLAATLVDSTASVANKRLTANGNPFRCNTYKKHGGGVPLRLTSYSFGVTPCAPIPCRTVTLAAKLGGTNHIGAYYV